MQIRPELALGSRPLHCRNYLSTDNNCTDVCASGFLDEFLRQNVHIGAAKRLNNVFCRTFSVCKNNSDALSSFEELDDNRNGSRKFYNFTSLFGAMCKCCDTRYCSISQ